MSDNKEFTPTPWESRLVNAPLDGRIGQPMTYAIDHYYEGHSFTRQIAKLTRADNPRNDIEYKPRVEENNAKLICASVNSYAAHCKDPIAAAEGDLLGKALELIGEAQEYAGHVIEYQKALRDGITRKEEFHWNKMEAFADKKRAILAQRRV